VNPWPHSIGFILAVIGVCYIAVRFHAHASTLVVMSVYGVGLLLAFGGSALYHWMGGAGPRRNAVFRRIDHASIYALIACTYTPLLYFGLDGAWRIATLSSAWTLALLGIAQSLWYVNAPRALATALYAVLGWVAVVPFVKLAGTLSHPVILLFVLGGLMYSLGGAIYATRAFDFAPGRFGFHEVFHIFVLAGAVLHFSAIVFGLVTA
jgi:hemolysin III